MVVKILPNATGQANGKLADVEVHFTDGPFEGLKLLGFAVWAERTAGRGRNVTFPSRTYSINGERRSFALLRPFVDEAKGQALREVILAAYRDFEAQVAPVVEGRS